ncbi:MAG: hypothetical protein R2878_02205 [Thermoleophilia bacterium]
MVGSAGDQVGILEHASGDVLISSETGIMTRLDPSRAWSACPPGARWP